MQPRHHSIRHLRSIVSDIADMQDDQLADKAANVLLALINECSEPQYVL